MYNVKDVGSSTKVEDQMAKIWGARLILPTQRAKFATIEGAGQWGEFNNLKKHPNHPLHSRCILEGFARL